MNPDRAAAIRRHLFAHGQSSVTAIAAAIGASEPTVRRDLAALEDAGQVERIHGGARIADGTGVEVAFAAREQINLAAKRAISAAAWDMLCPDSAIFLDAGTTVLQLARQIRLNPMPLRVFTNCLPVAELLMPVPAVSVTLLGGHLRPQNASMVGTLAVEALRRLWFDQLFLGAGAITDSAEIFSADPQEAELNTIMLTRATDAVVLCDATKFGNTLTYLVAPLGDGTRVVTDDRLAPAWADRLAERGTGITRVALGGSPAHPEFL